MTSPSEPWTIGRLLQWTTAHLRDKGSDSPRLEAEVLLAQARNCSRVDLYTAYEEVADEGLRSRFRELVRRRLAGTPVAYLVGHREFYSLAFEVTPDVLIPRPETEHVVLKLLELASSRETERPLRIADMGTGSGILAVCAAKYLGRSEVVAVDRSAAALEVARRNLERHGVQERVKLVQSDWFERLEEEPPFDFIVANPPYVSRSEFETLPREVREQEPTEALVSDEEGLADTRRIAEAAPAYLATDGWLILETSPMLAGRVVELLSSCGFEEVTVEKDLTQHDRVVSGKKGAV